VLNGIHNNKSKEKNKREEENESGEQKGKRVANMGASILPDSGESEQQKPKKKGPAIKDRRL
jgi:hypothetical protein